MFFSYLVVRDILHGDVLISANPQYNEEKKRIHKDAEAGNKPRVPKVRVISASFPPEGTLSIYLSTSFRVNSSKLLRPIFKIFGKPTPTLVWIRGARVRSPILAMQKMTMRNISCMRGRRSGGKLPKGVSRECKHCLYSVTFFIVPVCLSLYFPCDFVWFTLPQSLVHASDSLRL